MVGAVSPPPLPTQSRDLIPARLVNSMSLRCASPDTRAFTLFPGMPVPYALLTAVPYAFPRRGSLQPLLSYPERSHFG